MPDYIQLLFCRPPKYSVFSLMRDLKGKSAMMIFDKHSNLKRKFGNRKFRARGMTLVQWASMKQQCIYENKTGKTGMRTFYSEEYETLSR